MSTVSIEPLAPAERARLLDMYRDGHRVVLDALAGATEQELDARPAAPDEWTARQVVHHLADSEMISAYRLRRLIAEDSPVIQGYEEPRYARTLFYDDRPIGPSLDALAAARASTLQILERLSEAQWRREGIHSESGRYGVATWLRIYAAHAHDHADQIRRAIAIARVAGGPPSC
jgi:hypothetical protein